MAKYDADPTVMAFDVPEDIAPKLSPMSGKRPDLQPTAEYSPYSLDPTVMAFDPMAQFGEILGGAEAKAPPKEQPNPYVAEVLKRMFQAREGLRAGSLAIADLPMSLPAQLGGAITYGVSRLGGAEPERAQQLSEYVSKPLSYLEPGKLASLREDNPIGQGSQAYQLSAPAQVMDLISRYGVEPAVQKLVDQGMAVQDAQQLVTNAALLIPGGIKLGRMGLKAVSEMPAWARELKTPTPERIEPMMDVTQPQSVGAAQASPAAVLRGNVQAAISNASPELQAHIQSKPLESINLPALETRALEEKHGVNLLADQRTGDTASYAHTWNNRAKYGLEPDFANQVKELSQAFESSKQRHAPDIPSTADASELGQYQINALAAKDQIRLEAIDNAYKRMIEANGGQFPIDVKTLETNINSELSKQMKSRHLPASIEGDVKQFLENPTFEGYEALRTNLANVMRSNADGNVKGAAFIVREQLEKMPVFNEQNAAFDPKAAELKAFADVARSLVTERKNVIKTNPAYRSAINEFADLKQATSQGESLNAANFHKKFVANATPEAIRRMKSEIPPDDIANQAITFAELDRAKNAMVNASETKTKDDTFAKFLRDNKSKLNEALPPGAMQDVSELGFLNSKRGKPEANVFNYSNSYSSLIGDMAKQGLLSLGEAKLAMMTKGASLPVTPFAKQFMEKMNKDAYANRQRNPFTGLTKE